MFGMVQVHPSTWLRLDLYTLSLGDGWIWHTLPVAMVGLDSMDNLPPAYGWIGHPASSLWLDWPLTMVGFETPYPRAMVGLVHPAPGYGWI
jgi:hypothetical protein